MSTQNCFVADAIATELRRAGVSHVFGFPGGGSNLSLIDALAAADIDFCLCHTEMGAAFMACTVAEVTGVPGVVVVGNGPGLASVVDGVAHASLDRVPLLVISDRYTDIERETTGHQVLDQQALLAPVVKWSVLLEAGSARETFRQAVAIASAHPRGPVHIDVQRPITSMRVEGLRDTNLNAGNSEVKGAGFVGSHSHPLREIRDRIGAARYPVILAGLEAAAELEPGDIERLAESVVAPVMTTYKAKGVINEYHALWAGILTGGVLEEPVLDQADLLITIGLDPVELLALPWRFTAPTVSLSAHARSASYFAPEHAWVGALRGGVVELLSTASASQSSQWHPSSVEAFRSGAEERLRTAGGHQELPTWKIVAVLREELPDNTFLAVDAGAHMFTATTFWRAGRPRRFTISNGLASMGYAIPAVVAASAVLSDWTCVAVTGDGGAAYNFFELETASRLGLSPIVVVINDSGLSLIKIKHEKSANSRGPFDFNPTRFAPMAEALGAYGSTVESPIDLRCAIRDAIDAGRPALIDVVVSGNDAAPTMAAVRG